MAWRRSKYTIDQSGERPGLTREVSGLSDGLFGIRRESEHGFRITHIPTGFSIVPRQFVRLKDAVTYCEEIRQMLEWECLTVEEAARMAKEMSPKLKQIAAKYRCYTLLGDLVESEAA